MKHVLLKIAGHTIRWTWVSAIALSVLAVIAYGVARFYLPTLLQNKAAIEQTLEKLSGQKVEIGSIGPWWNGVHPGVRAKNVRVFGSGMTQPTVKLDEVRVSVSLLPLLHGKFTIYSLVVVHPQVVLELLPHDRVRVTGFSPVSVKSPIGKKATSAPEDHVFMDWLFAQRRMAIQDGVLKWVDDRGSRSKAEYLTHVKLALENDGQEHHLAFTAAFPVGMCGKCALDVDITGNPLVGSQWGGRVSIDAMGLNLSAVPAVVRTGIAKELSGQLNLELRTQWSRGALRVAQGTVDAADLRLVGSSGQQEGIPINRLRAGIQWQGHPDAWQLNLTNALIGLGGVPWNAGYVRVDHSPNLSRVQIRRVDLSKLASYVMKPEMTRAVSDLVRRIQPMHPSAEPGMIQKFPSLVKRIRPAGTIDNLIVQYDRRVGASNRWVVQGKLNNIQFNPYKKLPGIDGLSGYLLMTDRSGALRLDSGISTFRLPWMFRQPIPLRRALGRIRWERKINHWSIVAQDLRVAGDAVVHGNLQAQIPYDQKKSPQLKMHFGFSGGDLAYASRYYPFNRLHKKLLRWLDQAIVSGEVVDGHLDFDGPTRSYPFLDGGGKFEVEARVRNVVLNYLKGWPPIRGADATLLFRGPAMLITADDGRIKNLQISDVVVNKAVVKDPREPVVVTGHIQGPVETAMDILRHTPRTENGEKLARLFPTGLVATGNGAANLHVDIPHDAEETRIRGEYRFLGGSLQLPVRGIVLTGMRGTARFSHAGIDDGKVHASLLGGSTVITAATRVTAAGKETVFRGQGTVLAPAVATTYGPSLGRLVSGSANWSGVLRIRDGLPNIQIRSDLVGVRTSLPRPFESLATKTPQTVLATVVSDHRRNLLRMRLGGKIGGLFDFREHGGRWGFDRGQVVLGKTEAQLPGSRGLEILLKGAHVNGGPWIHFIHDGSDKSPDFLTRVSVDVNQLTAFGFNFGKFILGLNHQTQGWAGSVGGNTAAGEVVMQPTQYGTHLTLDLERLRLPRKVSQTSVDKSDPRTFPSISLRSKHFFRDGTDLGKLDMNAVHNELGWRIAHLNVDGSVMQLRTSGNWYKVVGHDAIDYNVQLKSSDLQKTLAAIGFKGLIRGGNLDLKLGLHWREDPDRPGLRNLDGTVHMTARNGSILNVNQGAARIAGLFNLRSLAELLTLNFKSVSGFSFSDITGRVAIHDGIAYTDGITVRGSSADIVARGKMSLIDRKLDLLAEISPNLRGPVTFASGWLWGPQTAALVLALQEIFHRDIEKGTQITYKITGTLNKPKVTQTSGAAKKKENAK